MKTDIYKLLTGKVRITSDSIMNVGEAQRFSDRVKHEVDRAFMYSKNKPDWESYGSESVWTMINDTDDSMFRRVALNVFSTTWAIDALKSLTIYVEGRCPECGEPVEDIEGTTEYDYAAGTIISEPIASVKCTLCKWSEI